MKMKMNGGWRSVRQTPNKYTLSTIEGGSDDKIKKVMINSDIILKLLLLVKFVVLSTHFNQKIYYTSHHLISYSNIK